RLRAASPSSRRAANTWKTCGTPGVMSRMTATSSAAAFTARRVASSRSTSCDPAWISSGGSPARSAKMGLTRGSAGSVPARQSAARVRTAWALMGGAAWGLAGALGRVAVLLAGVAAAGHGEVGYRGEQQGRRGHRQALRLAGDKELDGEVAAGRLARYDDVTG